MTSKGSEPSLSPKYHFRVAVIGGGLSGACAATALATVTTENDKDGTLKKDRSTISIDIFDQGRSGVGGRTSTRVIHKDSSTSQINDNKDSNPSQIQKMQWDHGCQFLRADTPQFKSTIEKWIKRGWAAVYQPRSYNAPGADFFGMGGGGCGGPFYVGIGGMRRLVESVLGDLTTSAEHAGSRRPVRVFRGTRVAKIERRDTIDSHDRKAKWILYGVNGEAAFHDTPENVVAASTNNVLGFSPSDDESGYDAVILTDLSSSFGGWHRASAGVPDEFADMVRKRAGARVPLFTVMIAFERKLPVVFDTITFGDDADGSITERKGLWFACRTQSKPGMMDNEDENCHNVLDCWTLVSTPEYAIHHVTEIPMQSEGGTFLPQTQEILSERAVDLEQVFRQAIESNVVLTDGKKVALEDLPRTYYRDAQRWGSAIRAHQSQHQYTEGDGTKVTNSKREVMGVIYDSRRGTLGPTVALSNDHDDNPTKASFIADPSGTMLFQAGDMVSSYIPGAEGAALSGMDCGSYVRTILMKMAMARV